MKIFRSQERSRMRKKNKVFSGSNCSRKTNFFSDFVLPDRFSCTHLVHLTVLDRFLCTPCTLRRGNPGGDEWCYRASYRMRFLVISFLGFRIFGTPKWHAYFLKWPLGEKCEKKSFELTEMFTASKFSRFHPK